MTNKDYIDPDGYWADPDRNIRRMGNEGGEQEVIVSATETFSETEWKLICEALKAVPIQ